MMTILTGVRWYLIAVLVWGFPGGSDGKESTAMRETCVQSLGSANPLEKGKATHSSILAVDWVVQNSMDWVVHGVTKSWTQVSDFHFIS